MSDYAVISADLIGLDLPPERVAHLVRLYGAIWPEICKLRELDLSQVHPALVFDPRSISARGPA